MFQQIKPPQKEIRALKKKIQELIYKHIFSSLVVEIPTILNNSADDVIEDAFRSGKAYFLNGYILTKSGKYSNSLSSALEKIGGVHNGNGYYLPKLPSKIQQIAEKCSANTQKLSKQVINLKGLDSKQLKLFELELTPLLKTVGEKVIQDVSKDLKNNNIPSIIFDITDKQSKEITKNFTQSLLKPIKGWSDEQATKMRQDILQMLNEGKHPSVIKDYLKNRYSISKRKAQFWARGECANYTSVLKKSEYQKNGFRAFIWRTNIDGRERTEHKKYNGMIFYFNDLPIIDKRTGKKGLPGEAYGCRCNFTPSLKGFEPQ